MDIALALGGGGARGNAHLGVLRVLEREGFRIRAAAGTSFGGIVASLFAAGYSVEELVYNFSHVDQSRLYRHSPDDGPALLGLAGVNEWLDDIIGSRTFEGLRIPCALTAVDLKTGTEVILQRGQVKDAILASIAIPGIFPPREYGELELVDGGVMNPVPVSVARMLAPDLPVVAVVLSPALSAQYNVFKLPNPDSIPGMLVERLTRMRIAQAFNTFLQSVDVGNRLITELRLELDMPEVVIRPEVSHIKALDRVVVKDVVKLGEEATEKALSELKRAVSWPNRFTQRLKLELKSRLE